MSRKMLMKQSGLNGNPMNATYRIRKVRYKEIIDREY